MKLTRRTINKIRENKRIIGRLMGLFDRSERSIYNWLDDNDPRLTTLAALEVIKEELNIDDSDKLIEGLPKKVA